MPLVYDPAAEQFVLTSAITVPLRVDIDLEPTLENALLALELLDALKRSTSKLGAAMQRPDPLGMKKTSVDAAVDDYLSKGGTVTRSTYNPTAEATASRLRPQALQARTGSELLAALNIKVKSDDE